MCQCLGSRGGSRGCNSDYFPDSLGFSRFSGSSISNTTSLRRFQDRQRLQRVKGCEKVESGTSRLS